MKIREGGTDNIDTRRPIPVLYHRYFKKIRVDHAQNLRQTV